MNSERIDNINVATIEPLLTPEELHERLPLSVAAEATVRCGRRAIEDILDGRDRRLIAVVGPCSIHDPVAAMDYAKRLKSLADELAGELLIVMRAYFEKPRTTTGWKGLINDPHMDDSFDIAKGLAIARRLLLDINELGLPTGTEALDPISPQYLSDLIAWSAIGARTTESQTHREMASGLSTPVGFKNGTDGSLGVAVNSLLSVSTAHAFLGIDPGGRVSVVRTTGNRYGHVVLRGGTRGPNFDAAHVARVESELAGKGLRASIMIDCSHANSAKDPTRQPAVMEDVVNQILAGNRSIIGVMIESHLHGGNQAIPADHKALRYGVSVTDACLDWEATGQMLRDAASRLKGPGRRR